MGYLLCDKCRGCYELQEGESPEDFESCECGGTLKSVASIDKNNLKPSNQVSNNKTCPNCGAINDGQYLYCKKCGSLLDQFKTKKNKDISSKIDSKSSIDLIAIFIGFITCILFILLFNASGNPTAIGSVWVALLIGGITSYFSGGSYKRGALHGLLAPLPLLLYTLPSTIILIFNDVTFFYGSIFLLLLGFTSLMGIIGGLLGILIRGKNKDPIKKGPFKRLHRISTKKKAFLLLGCLLLIIILTFVSLSYNEPKQSDRTITTTSTNTDSSNITTTTTSSNTKTTSDSNIQKMSQYDMGYEHGYLDGYNGNSMNSFSGEFGAAYNKGYETGVYDKQWNNRPEWEVLKAPQYKSWKPSDVAYIDLNTGKLVIN